MNWLRKNLDYGPMLLLVGGFVAAASQRLGSVPVPDTDEAYMLQTSYEMLFRGKLALPFRRLLGGGIEDVWHSFTPLHYMIQSGFLKLSGWGLLPGRAFNLITAALVLAMLYLIARRMFSPVTGLIAVVLMLCDATFLERSRYLRNDYSSAMFALLALLLYEEAERRESSWLFASCGLAAGAALMCHTTALYMLVAIPILMLIKRGVRVIKERPLWIFASCAFVVSAYEVIYDLVDYQNVVLQNRGDRLHFKVLGLWGWWRNVGAEPKRYLGWWQGGRTIHLPMTLSHLFQLLTIIAVVYLIVRLTREAKAGRSRQASRTRLLVITAIAVSFFAVVTSQKAIYYFAHLAPLFALCVAVLLSDAGRLFSQGRTEWTRRTLARACWRATAVGLGLACVLLGYEFVRLQKRYVRELRNPDLISFREFGEVLRNVVPQGVCPVAAGEPVIWLAFPETDRCFLNLQGRMKNDVAIDGKEFALFADPQKSDLWIREAAPEHHLLIAELQQTPYGDFEVYYTGADPRWLSARTARFRFFDRRRGYVSDEELAGASQVWAADFNSMSDCATSARVSADRGGLTVIGARDSTGPAPQTLCEVPLKSGAVYRLDADMMFRSGQWALRIVDAGGGEWIYQKELGPDLRSSAFDHLFRLAVGDRVRIEAVQLVDTADPLHISSLTIREVAPLNRAD